MTETSDERLEVAERLRDSVRTGEYLDVSVVKALYMTMGEVNRPVGSVLADLIDPTCEMDDAGDVPASVKDNLNTFFCSECGAPVYNDMSPSYCPYCGARVVEGGDAR